MELTVKKSLRASIALVIVSGLAGCGSGETVPAAPPTLSGTAVDGLLSGMFCYADINNNATFDSGIDFAAESLTDTLGSYSISGEGVNSATTICRAEETAQDQATGERYTGQLSSPAGSDVVSPVTTLIVALGGDADAETAARTILGLDSGIDLKANPLQNPNLAKAASQIQAVISVITKSLSSQLGATSKSQQNAIAAEAFKALAANLDGQANGLTNKTAISNAINATTQAVSSSASNSSASELADAVESILNNIDTEYQSAIDSGDAFTADQLNTAQSNSTSNSALENAFTENSVSIQEDSLTVNENLVIDESESTATAPQKRLYSSDGFNDPETFQGEFPLSDFGNGASFDAGVTTDESFERVFSVTSGEGYGAGVHVAFVAFLNYSEGFTTGYDTFNAKVKGSPSNQVEIKFFGDNSVESAINIDLTTYEGATDIGNGWYEISVPFSEFTNGSKANFEKHSGWLIGPPGDQADETFVFFFTDIALSFENDVVEETDDGAGEGEGDNTETDNGTETDNPASESKILYSGTAAESDDPETFVALADFGSGASFDANVTTDTSFDRVFSVTSGEGYGAGVHVAFVAFTGYSAGFASGYEAIKVKVKGSPDGRVEVKLIGSGTDSVAEVNVNSYQGSTDLGNGWYELTIPFSEFTNNSAENIAAQTGWLIGPPGDQADETFVFFFTDAEFITLSSSEVVTTTPDKVLYSAVSADNDDAETFIALDNFGSGAAFDANITTDTSFDRVFSVTSGEGYGAGVHVAFAAFTGHTAGFASGYETFNAKVKGSPDGRIEIKLIGSGTDSVVEVNVDSYAGSTDLGNGWYELNIPFSEFSNNSAENIAAHTGWLIGPPGDQADETFVFYFTDTGFSTAEEETVEATTPDKVLYSEVSAENDDAETFVSLADFGSGASFDANVTTDTSFDRIFSVTSGEGYGAGVHVAFVAFTGYTAGFADGYETFNAKVKGSPDGRIEVKLIGSGTDSVVEVNVNSYAGSTDLGNGWYELNIPFSEFSNNSEANIAAQTGWLIGPPGDQADETFVFFFTQAGFSNNGEQADGGSDSGTDTGSSSEPKVIYSGTAAASDDPETFVSLADFGSGATFDANVTTDTSFDRVFSVTSGEGYGAGVHVAFVAFTGYTAGFVDGYETFNAKVKGSPDGRIEVKLIGSGTDSVVEVNVNSYSGSTDLGNGWYNLSIPFSEFSNSSEANIASQTGWLIGPPGDQADETFVFYFTDVEFGAAQEVADNTNYELVWSNEFNAGTLDNWNIETGYGPNGDGWGNDESQLYTSSATNLTVDNGSLVFTAECDLSVTGVCGKRDGSITSARVTTKDKMEFRYGKVEARIKVPAGTSTWPALWMLGAAFPDTPWPNAGEIDIMEVWQTGGSTLNQSNSTIHYFDGGRVLEGDSIVLADSLADDFRVWTMEWKPNSISVSVEGEQYLTLDTSDAKYAAFKEPFFLLMNIAIDGTLGGAPNEIVNTPQKMLVDYVRLYQDTANTENIFNESALPTTPDKVLYSAVSAANDDPETFVSLADFGSGATFDANFTTDTSFDRVFSVTSGEGYGEDVHVAFAAFTGYSAGFASGYDTFNAKVKASPDGRIEVKLIGSGTDSVVEINVNSYPGSSDLGNGWYELAIPISEFNNSGADNIAAHTGWLIGPPGDQADETFVFYFTDTGFSGS